MSSYVICKLDFEYNDEIEYREGTGGIPERVFSDQEEAEKELSKLNAKYFDGLDIGTYCYGLSEILNYNKLQPFGRDDEEPVLEAAIAEIIGRPFKFSENRTRDWGSGQELPRGLSVEQLEAIADLFTLKFYELYKVD